MKDERRETDRLLSSGIPVKTLYTDEDLREVDLQERPGQYPFTRGVHDEMYRKRLWTTRQYAGVGSCAGGNQLYKQLIQRGLTGLSVALDLPTQLGFDSDDEWAFPETGGVGVPIDTLADIELLFEGIDLEKISVSITVNATTPVILAMFLAYAKKKGFDFKKLTGTLQNDILKEYISRGTWIFPMEPSMKLAADVIEYCTRYVPGFNPISVCGYHMREAGANAVQEIAYTYLDARAYIDETLKRGLSIDDFAQRISFANSGGMNIFEEAAKFRAARRVWAKLMKEEYGATKPEAMKARFSIGSAASSLTAEQPLNNLARGAYMALGAVLGGIQALHISAYDEAYAIPTEESITLSIRIQQILAYETGITDTVDPLGGSYYVESLTQNMEKGIYEEMNRVEKKYGGICNAISKGYLQEDIYNQRYATEKGIKSGKIKIVGKNCFTEESEGRHLELAKWDEDASTRQVTALHKIRQERNHQAVVDGLQKLRKGIEKGENLMPMLIEAVDAYTTLGELTAVMKEYYGEYVQP
jgi:methylmalonyl-CoA mutase N-terminal domain/subunit